MKSNKQPKEYGFETSLFSWIIVRRGRLWMFVIINNDQNAGAPACQGVIRGQPLQSVGLEGTLQFPGPSEKGEKLKVVSHHFLTHLSILSEAVKVHQTLPSIIKHQGHCGCSDIHYEIDMVAQELKMITRGTREMQNMCNLN